MAFNVGPLRNESLPAVKLSELHRGVYASAAYCTANGVPQKPADLLKFSCIPLDTQRASGLWTFRVGNRRVSATSRFSVTDVTTALNMTRAGLGYAILPNFLCQDAVKSGSLRRVLPSWSIPLCWSRDHLERRMACGGGRSSISSATRSRPRAECLHPCFDGQAFALRDTK